MYEFEFSGEALCLDFANTVTERPTEHPIEHLESYGDLVSWGRQAGVLSPVIEAARNEAVFARALTLREALYRMLSAIASGQAPAPTDLDVLNRELAAAIARGRVVPAGGGFAWDYRGDPGAPDAMLWPVARSAADLLTSPELTKVTVCSARDCDWLFLDTSKNRSRRWCDMAVCGNREKARRLRERRAAR